MFVVRRNGSIFALKTEREYEIENLLSNTMKTLFFEHKSNALFFVA